MSWLPPTQLAAFFLLRYLVASDWQHIHWTRTCCPSLNASHRLFNNTGHVATPHSMLHLEKPSCDTAQVEAFYKAAARGGKGLSNLFKRLTPSASSKALGTPGSTGSGEGGGFTLEDLLMFSNVSHTAGQCILTASNKEDLHTPWLASQVASEVSKPTR